ncbi:putative nucleoporin [Cryptosporidium canis]|nr:putative nucleoporin [Cryptosporidium canis]
MLYDTEFFSSLSKIKMLGGGGFGSNQNQQSSSGMFGTSTSFGVGVGQQGVSQNLNSIQQPSTGLFNSSTSLFGGNTNSGLFGSSNSSNNGFGSTGQTSVFGQPSNGLFGQSMGTFGGNQQIGSTQSSIFGSSSSSGVGSNSGFFNSSSTGSSGGFGSFQNSFGTTGVFGSQSSQSNPTNYFGQQNNNGIFGSMPPQTFGGVSSSPFGGAMGTNTNIFGAKKGTSGITFQPIVDRDSDARIMSIVYQKEIDQKKSVEELRWEDYQEKRGPTGSLSTMSTGFPQNNSNTFGSSTFTPSTGGFNSNTQGSSISSSIFGQPQTSFIGSTTQGSLFNSSNSSTGLGQTPLLNQNIQNSQPSMGSSQFGSNGGGLFGASNNSSSFTLQTSTNNSNTGLFSAPTLFSGNNNNNNSVGSGSGSLNSGSLFGQSSNLGSLDTTFKTSGSLFGGPATSANTGLGLFNSNQTAQPQISLPSSSLGVKPLFGNNQTLNSSNIGTSSTTSGTSLSLSTSLFGSTLPSSSGLFSIPSSNNLFGQTQPQNTLGSNSGTSSSSLFGQPSSISQPLGFTGNNPSSSSWQVSNNVFPSSLAPQTSTTGNSQTNNSTQIQNILGGQLNKSAPSQGSSLVIANGLSMPNKLSNSILSKQASQSSKCSDSSDRGRSLWLWKPLPQFISRSNRYNIDSLVHAPHEGVAGSSELALPALATESARHSNALLTSVRRIEKTIDPQTPAAFLNLLERQQQFFDAIQSPEQNNSSPINSKARSLVFSTSHATKFVPIDETFEDAIDDSSSAAFSPRTSKTENKSVTDGAKSLINLESISRISRDIQISKKEDYRNSIGRASIESNTTRTPYLNQHRNSVNSVSAVSNERQARTSIGLTTPRPITRRSDQLVEISSDLSKSYQKKENIIESLAPVLTKSDYFCIPSIEVLKTFSEERLAAVEDFKIVREGVGEIIWPGITDVRGINLDLVVSIEPLCVSVYGDGDSSIPIGEGLNKKAIVTLKNCRPKRPITSKDPLEIEEFNTNRVKQIKSYTEQMGARFISLDIVTWDWKFEVSHFSKYGLLSEDGHINNRLECSSMKSEIKEMNSGNHLENNLPPPSLKQEQQINHFFVGMSQYNFNLYSEIKDMLENNKDYKKSMHNVVSFRCGIYIGSKSFFAIPHRSSTKDNYKLSDYNTSITIFRLNRESEIIQTKTENNLQYNRRLISAWLRSYLGIIEDKTMDGNSEITMESLMKLTFMLWKITKKEIRVSSHLSEFNIKSSSLYYLQYFERSFSLICGMLELVNNSSCISGKFLERNLRELISWWIRPTLKNYPETRHKYDEYSQKLVEETVRLLLGCVLTGSIYKVVSSSQEIFLTIPRASSLCLSVGNCSDSILQLKENLQWWSKINISSDFTNASNKLYKTISSADFPINDFSYECQTNLYLSANYLEHPLFCDKLRAIENTTRIDNACKSGKLLMPTDYAHVNKSVANNNQIFDDTQLKIMQFFLCDNRNREVELARFNKSRSNRIPPSFTWIITRVLTLYYNINGSFNESSYSNKLNLMLVEELQALGMWEWAVYVAIHTKMHLDSANMVNCIIMRNIQENPEYNSPEDYLNDSKWDFLVKKVGVPPTWLIEAMIYKLESSGNILKSLKFTMHLINGMKHIEKYKIGDLFFQQFDYMTTLKSLAISAAEKIFDASILPTALKEISTILRYVITEKKVVDISTKYYIYLKDATGVLLTILCSTNDKLFETCTLQCFKLLVTISNQYMKLAIRSIEYKSPSIGQDEMECIISNFNQLVALREDPSKYRSEPHIKNIMNNECWDIIINTIWAARDQSK